MRAAAALSIGAFVAATTCASCTLLVQFHDEGGGALGDGCTGPLCVDDTSTGGGPDAHHDGTSPPQEGGGKDAGRDAGGSDATDERDEACRGLANGYYCGDDGLRSYGGNPGDLVYCLDGGVGRVTNCDGGCVHITDPFPDSCDPCVGIGNGAYCGRNLPGFPASNADFLIDCTSGKVSLEDACAHGCDSKGTASTCFP